MAQLDQNLRIFERMESEGRTQSKGQPCGDGDLGGKLNVIHCDKYLQNLYQVDLKSRNVSS